MKTTDQVDEASRLLKAYRELTWLLSRAPCSGIRLQAYLSDDDKSTCAWIPREMTHAAIGALRGIVHGELLRLGVDVDGTTEMECFECGGTGTQDKR